MFTYFSLMGNVQVVVAYNPLGWNRTDIIRIPVCIFLDLVLFIKQIFVLFGNNQHILRMLVILH